ncbi:hypothetical protein RE428_36030 [Marinobacter nanhaiticus D15-8W]|uniref:Uncharacterized protein n=1 Tax=Marinobacter nanhaiticus D15-8W TaxID=626887 RepID=N6WZ04_9GAMM|nr:hypothetical protein [Marinobacter nanhaiticus]ENO16771.1 hypothetical protein J057_03665 [Marinobacter nanhaiticus D15-8W]BES72585.1 hypothetical protein RE428_36030 [Marinobacter nanhaiticus D15-8W]
MVFALIVALVALTGYIYCHSQENERKKLAWHAKQGGLYYRYAAAGLLFSVLGYLIFFTIYKYAPQFVGTIAHFLLQPFYDALPENHSAIDLMLGTALTSIGVSYVFGKLGSMRAAKHKNKLVYKEIRKTEDSFSHLLLVAIENRLTVLVNLDDNDVYVGYPLEFYTPYIEHSWIQILPVMSGYRDRYTKELNLTEDYQGRRHEYVKNKLHELKEKGSCARLDDFSLTIKMDRIQSITLFHIPAYVERIMGKNSGDRERV